MPSVILLMTYSIDPSSASVSYDNVSPSRSRFQIYNERSIVSSIYTRISVDVSSILIKHVKIDDNERYLKDMSEFFK